MNQFCRLFKCTRKSVIHLARVYGEKKRNFVGRHFSVNMEFCDYMALSLSTKLNLATPDRLDEMLTGVINDLCKNAWDNFNSTLDTAMAAPRRLDHKTKGQRSD